MRYFKRFIFIHSQLNDIYRIPISWAKLAKLATTSHNSVDSGRRLLALDGPGLSTCHAPRCQVDWWEQLVSAESTYPGNIWQPV